MRPFISSCFALITAVAGFSAAPLAAQADFSIGVRASTLGIGLEASKLVTSHLGVRVAAHTFSHDLDRTEEDITYAVEGKLKGVTALVDIYPSGRGSFHLSGGILTTPAEITGVGQPSGDSYTINGNEYTAAEVGTVRGEVVFPSASPYVGLGWGTPASRSGGLGFVFDLGAAFGTPTLNLSASSAVPGSQLAQDVEAERVEVQDDIDRYFKVFPVISIGIVYRF